MLNNNFSKPCTSFPFLTPLGISSTCYAVNQSPRSRREPFQKSPDNVLCPMLHPLVQVVKSSHPQTPYKLNHAMFKTIRPHPNEAPPPVLLRLDLSGDSTSLCLPKTVDRSSVAIQHKYHIARANGLASRNFHNGTNVLQ